MIVTNLALIDVDDGEFVLRELAPGVSVDDVRAATGGRLRVPDGVPEMQL